MDEIKDKKKFGKFYTSSHLAGLFSVILFNEFFKCNNPKNISILDPSCGNGIFLSESVNQLKNVIQKSNNNLHVSLCGIDIDENAVSETIMQLKTILAHNSCISCFIAHSDTLIDNKTLNKNYINIQNTFSSIMKNGGFDIIIGNPPWVSLAGKHAQNIYSKKQIGYLLKRYPCDKYRPNLFEVFIWRSLELLKPGGYLAFIVPDRLFHNYQFAELRKIIFTECELTHIISGAKFDNVKSDNLMFILKKSKPKIDSKIKIKHISDSHFESLNQSYIFRNQKYKYIFIKSGLRSIVEKIENNSNTVKLSSLFDTGVGFIGIKKKISLKRLSPNQSKIITGRDMDINIVHKYKYFEFIQKNILGGTTNISKLSKRPKIVIRKTGNRLKASLEMKGYLPEQSLYYIISKRDSLYDLLFLNRILNSDLMNFYYLNAAVTNINTTPQLKKRDLDNLPVVASDYIFNSIKTPESQAGEETPRSFKKKLLALSEKDIFSIFGISTGEQLIIENFLKEK